MDKNDIIKAVKNGSSAEDILNNLSASDRAAVEKMLEDKNATERLLNSPAAKALYNALFGGDKNG